MFSPPAAAIQRGRNAPVQLYSAAFTPSASVEAEIESTLCPGMSHIVRDSVLNDPTKVTQFAIAFSGKIGILTRPHPFTNSEGDTVILGSLSDTIGHHTPVSISPKIFRASVTTLVEQRYVTKYHLPHSEIPPDTIDGPNSDDEADAASMERLQFGNPTEADMRPWITVVPVCLPIAPGRRLDHAMDLSTPTPLLRTEFPLAAIWKRSLQYLVATNDSKSVTLDGPLFDRNKVPGSDEFDGFAIIPVLPSDDDIKILSPFSEEYKRVISVMKAFDDQVWGTLGQVDATDGGETGQPTPAPNGNSGLSIEDAKTLLESISKRPSSRKEEEQLSEAKENATRWKLVTGHIAPSQVSGNPGVVSLGKMQDGFTNALTITNKFTATRGFFEHLLHLVGKAKTSELFVERSVTLDASIANEALVSCLRSYNVALEPAHYDATAFLAKFSVLCCLTPDTVAATWSSVQDELSKLPMQQETQGKIIVSVENTNKSVVYTKGQIREGLDVVALMCNLRLFFTAIAEDFAESSLWASWKRYLDVVDCDRGRKWFARNRKSPQVALNVALDIQHILSEYLRVGQTPAYRIAIRDGATIDPKIYDQAEQVANKLATDLSQCISTGEPGRYNTQNAFVRGYFPELSSKNKTPPTGSSDDPVKKKAKVVLSDEDKEKRKKQGALLWKGAGPPPKIPVYMKKMKDSKTEERLCNNFVFQDRFCANQRCPLVHMTNPQKLPKKQNGEIILWVKDTPGVEWAEGKGPAVFENVVSSIPLLDYNDSARPWVGPNAIVSVVSKGVTPTIEDANEAIAQEVEPLPEPEEFYPILSDIVKGQEEGEKGYLPVPTLNNSFRKREREAWKAKYLSPNVQALLDQPFGKESISQCFLAEACLRHVLLPLRKSGFLSVDEWRVFAAAVPEVRTLEALLTEYGDLDFNPVRGYQKNWQQIQQLDTQRVAMASAALLHFDGDAAAMVRWVGGPHVGQHRHVDAIEAYLSKALDTELVRPLVTLFRNGSPFVCNASSTEKNYQAYARYGNHSTVDIDPEKTLNTVVKDAKRGYTIPFDCRVIPFILNCHLTPQGIVDLDKKFKVPRPIFDSTFRPEPWCESINDWITKETEPPLPKESAEMEFMKWLYNLRVSYPSQEIYIGDDDVSGAFRNNKYPPNLVAMHTSVQAGYGILQTGNNFGDNTNPSNWMVIATARQHLARKLWHSTKTVTTVKRFMPDIQFQAAPTIGDITEFVPAQADTKNQGVYDRKGKRIAPPYVHHVDDNPYADVKVFMERTVMASALALFYVMGFPREEVPTSLSMDKLDVLYSHTRRVVGRAFNSRKLSVGMLPHKLEQLLEILRTWLTEVTAFTIIDAAALAGLLENHTRYVPWARPMFYTLTNILREELRTRYYIVKRRYKTEERAERLFRQLPNSLRHRVTKLLEQEKAALLWRSRAQISMNAALHGCLELIYKYLRETDDPWSSYIGFVIPRDPDIVSQGDASSDFGGGGYCPTLKFWFDIKWGPRVKNGLKNVKPGLPGYVHINSLEFLMIIIQLAAIVERMRTLDRRQAQQMFPNGVPIRPIVLCKADNTVSVSWGNKATSVSLTGQGLVAVYCGILRDAGIGINCEHIAGILNTLADDLSRQTNYSIPLSIRYEQLCSKNPQMKTWDYFLPSRELLQLLTSALFTGPVREPPEIPRSFGRFVRADSITSASPEI